MPKTIDIHECTRYSEDLGAEVSYSVTYTYYPANLAPQTYGEPPLEPDEPSKVEIHSVLMWLDDDDNQTISYNPSDAWIDEMADEIKEKLEDV
jgi:hypothetical protein